jgi:hypothetical protein
VGKVTVVVATSIASSWLAVPEHRTIVVTIWSNISQIYSKQGMASNAQNINTKHYSGQ